MKRDHALEELRRGLEHRTEVQIAASRRRTHDNAERIRSRKDRGGVGFDPPRPETPSLHPHPDGGFYVQPGDKGDR